ncbi:MAG: cbb3-type cytochrome c oxidase subunit 3 [Phycisphaerales bacterium]
MTFGDLIGNMDLATFPKVAMVIFIAVFAAVLYRAVTLGRREDIERAARLALDDGAEGGTQK